MEKRPSFSANLRKPRSLRSLFVLLYLRLRYAEWKSENLRTHLKDRSQERTPASEACSLSASGCNSKKLLASPPVALPVLDLAPPPKERRAVQARVRLYPRQVARGRHARGGNVLNTKRRCNRLGLWTEETGRCSETERREAVWRSLLRAWSGEKQGGNQLVVVFRPWGKFYSMNGWSGRVRDQRAGINRCNQPWDCCVCERVLPV